MATYSAAMDDEGEEEEKAIRVGPISKTIDSKGNRFRYN